MKGDGQKSGRVTQRDHIRGIFRQSPGHNFAGAVRPAARLSARLNLLSNRRRFGRGPYLVAAK